MGWADLKGKAVMKKDIRTMTQRAAMTLSMLSVLALAACGGGGGQVGTTTGPVVAGATATVVIRNVSRETIYYVYMSPSSDSNWGPDLLGSSTLAVGQSLTLSNINGGVWDLRVVDGSGHWKEWRNENIQPGTQYTLDVDGENWNSQR